ncbi:MAG TPA: hypothetical protein VF014_05105 [Casimicrobiaceae bacterium]|nr:hypothetical protein [Casimicrobiaceae bacterium]
MNIGAGGAMLFAACVGTAFAMWLRRKLHDEKQTHELQEWENEGGNPAPSPQLPDRVLKPR